MWIEENEFISLKANKIKSLIRFAAHCAHDDVWLIKYVPYWLHVALFNFFHANPTGQDHQAAIPEFLKKWVAFCSWSLLRVTHIAWILR